jgi:hypothetical protein
MKVQDRREVEALRHRRSVSTWQHEAWAGYDLVGEIKYGFMMVGAVMSRMRLFVGAETKPSDPPSALDDLKDFDPVVAEMAQRQLARLNNSHGGISGLLREATINLQVAGECYLVQELPAQGVTSPEKWSIRSVGEILPDANGIVLQTSRLQGEAGKIRLPKDAFCGRIWRTHPYASDEADSSMKALLDLIRELLLLSRTFKATARSRLNAGALFIPDGLSVAASPETITETPAGEEVDAEDDLFERELMDAMTAPILEEESASAVVPLLIRGPGELGAQIKQFKFERSFDAALVDRADRVLERILQGIDLPKEVVTGLSSLKYANAVAMDASLFRAHIEPLALLLCDALTMMFMRPALLAGGCDPKQVEKVYVWYDPSQILTSSDRANDASEGWDRYLLSGSAWRTAHGFADTDSPTGEELLYRIIAQRGQLTAEMTEAVLQQIAPDVLRRVREGSLGQGAVPESVQQLLEGKAPAAGEPLPEDLLEGLPAPGGVSTNGGAPTSEPTDLPTLADFAVSRLRGER